MAREIALTRGMVAIVDDEDFERLSAFNWQAVEGRRGAFYASRCVAAWEGLGVRVRQMQRDVLDPEGRVPRTLIADHRDGNTLDCRKHNLRWATFEQSNRNRRVHLNNQSGFRGVFKDTQTGRWRAQIRAEGRRISGGRHETPEAAAAAYNALALKHHGADAQLNIIGNT